MTVAWDEASELREALCRGVWQRLTDPLLEFLVWDQPDVWRSMVQNCARALAFDAMETDPTLAVAEVHVWALAVFPAGEPDDVDPPAPTRPLAADVPGRLGFRGLVNGLLLSLPAEGRTAALLVLARQVVTCWPGPDRRAALAVLERWPAE